MSLPPPSPPRDIRLDFIRGLALLVIFVNHMPNNAGQFFTLSRYGWSDAAEVFVFCSGFVSARVFGQAFARSGLWPGTARVLQRCVQIYAAHLGLFGALALSCLIGNALFPPHDYIQQLNIRFFFEQTHEALPALVTLRYLPNGIDILPMYLVLLLWTPVFWALSELSRALAVAASLALYLATYRFNLELSAEPATTRGWFFNPFAWQLVFFGGYLLGAGWIRIRLGQRWPLRLSLALVLLAAPFAHEALLRPFAWMAGLHELIEPWYDKTRLGPLRLLHFAALGYLVASWLARSGAWLERPLARQVRMLGQQSLAIFALGLLLSRMGGMLLDQTGHGWLPLLAVNVGGLALLLGLGQLLAWLDGKPWKHPARMQPARLAGSFFDLDTFRRACLRPLALVLMLLPLAATPFLLPKKPAPPSASEEPWLGAEPTLDVPTHDLRAAADRPRPVPGTRGAPAPGRLARLGLDH